MEVLDASDYSDPDRLRLFMKCLLTDLRALEKMLADGRIESDVRRIGAEQEIVLTDSMGRPAPVALEVLETLNDPVFTTELSKFNIEANLAPIVFEGACLSRFEDALRRIAARAQAAAEIHGARALLTGILPTLRKADLDLDNMTPSPRYIALNEAMKRLRGGAFEFRFTGTDELIVRHDSVMLEAANTSCQFHFQVGPDEFARLYNIAQFVTAPVLAVAVNSPLLFGRRLWQETRIALFQQATDTRVPGHQLEDRCARVSFGTHWIKESVCEIFREDIARFRVILGIEVDEDPFAVLASDGSPRLKALRLHNGTTYRWNRPCYGVCDGKPHLRIENRALPAGPTVLDEVANAAFWFGLMSGVASKCEDITEVVDFDTAKANFLAAARLGLDANLTWLDGSKRPAQQLICEELIPLAQEGLRTSGICPDDIEHYLGVIQRRASSGQTGASWHLASLHSLKSRGNRSKAELLSALTGAAWTRQQENEPVDGWSLARIEEGGGWQNSFKYVDQFMTTDVYTVNENDVIDLAASLMDWKHIRYVPVENEHRHLVGIISYRQLLRFLAQDLPHDRRNPVPVRDIMLRNPTTASPDTSTLEAIEIMRREGVPCLPVVKDERVIGIVTEYDFIDVAAQLLEQKLRDA